MPKTPGLADRADFLSRAAWSSASIILSQTSPESISIFQFILEVYKSCEGNWPELASSVGIEIEELRRFLDYAAVFLGNIGNYFVSHISLNPFTSLKVAI